MKDFQMTHIVNLIIRNFCNKKGRYLSHED